MFANNLNKLREKMKEHKIDLAVITDDDSLYYFTGYHDFLHMDFNRPTILLTFIFSDSPLTLGFKQHTPLIINSTFTPFLLALYKLSIRSLSTKELHLSQIPAGFFFFLFLIS